MGIFELFKCAQDTAQNLLRVRNILNRQLITGDLFSCFMQLFHQLAEATLRIHAWD